MSLQPEHLPLTLKESGEVRLGTFENVDQKVKEVLKPNRKLLQATLEAAGLSVPVQFSFEVTKQSVSLSQHFAYDLFKKPYPELSEEQKYFIAVIDAIIKQNGIASDRLEPKDGFVFDFANGTFAFVHREEEAQTYDLLFKTPEELTLKTREEIRTLIKELEEKNILYDAMRRFNDDASFEGRVAYIKKNKDSFVDTINLYISDPKQKLDKTVASFAYRGSQTQNIAYLKAYLALKRQEKLGEPLPQPEPAPLAPETPDIPTEEVDESKREAFIQDLNSINETLTELNAKVNPSTIARLESYQRTQLKIELDGARTRLANISEEYAAVDAPDLHKRLDTLKDLNQTLTAELDKLIPATPLPEVPLEEQIRELAEKDWATIEQEKPYIKLLVLNEKLTKVIHGYDALSPYLSDFHTRPAAEKAAAKAMLESLKTDYDKITQVNEDLGELQTPAQRMQRKELLRVLESYKGTYATYAEVFNKEPEPVAEPEPAPTPEQEIAHTDDALAEVETSMREILEPDVKAAGEALGLDRPLMTADDLRVGIDHYKNNIPNQVNALVTEFTASNGQAYVKAGPTVNRLVNEGSSMMSFELVSQDGKIYNVNAETLPVDMAALNNYISLQATLGQTLDRDQVIEYLTYQKLSEGIQKDVEKLRPKIQKDFGKFENKSGGHSPAPAPETGTEAAPRLSAEHQELEEQFIVYVPDGEWKAVERIYQKVLALPEGDEPTGHDHFLGAQAAESRGDINLVVERYAKALASGLNEEERLTATATLENIKMNCTQVSINVAPAMVGTQVMSAEVMPWNVTLRRNIELVQKQVMETGHYEGYLAIGEYNFNGTVKQIEHENLIQVVNIE